ncbi:MAG: polysaccharide pyruvyl transferase family protein [Bacillota bacterium]
MTHMHSPEDRYRLTLCGSFGFGNVGDEAASLAVSDLAEMTGKSLRLDVLSRYDNPASQEVIGLAVCRNLRVPWLQTQPALYVGGGVIEPSKRCVLLRCHQVIGSRCQPSLFCAAVESGVAYGWLIRRQLRKALGQMQHLYVRDQLSAKVLRQLIPGRSVEVTGDIVLWMQPADEALPELKSLDRFIAVSLSPRWKAEPMWRSWIADGLVRLSRDLKAAVVFVPCSTAFDDDRPEHQSVAEVIRTIAPDVETICITMEAEPRRVAAILRRALLVVGMRLHACVLALSQRVPCVGLAYHPKLLAFAQTMGCDRYFLPQCADLLQQSQNTYGYRFGDSGLGNFDMTRVAREAVDSFDFTSVEVMRKRSQEAFVTVLAAVPPIVPVTQGV